MHRMNIGFNFHRPHGRGRGESIWNVSVYNVYNSLNPNFVLLTEVLQSDPASEQEQWQFIIKKITILPILPTFSYTYEF